MSVLISNVTANFANANFAYSAIGLNIRDFGSSNASKLLHITANGDPRLTIFKDGGLRVKGNISQSLLANLISTRSTVDILNINDQMKVRKNWLEQSKDFSSEINTHDTAFAEEYEYVRTSNGSVFLNLSNSTSFRVESSTNTITKLVFIKPTDTHTSKNRVYSCMVMFSGINNIDASVWAAANISWLEGKVPRTATNNIQIITFYSPTMSDYTAFNNVWFGTGG